jgi:hypothetical protein
LGTGISVQKFGTLSSSLHDKSHTGIITHLFGDLQKS